MSTTVKLMFLSTAVLLSAAFALKLSAPTLTEFAVYVYEFPSIYNNVVSWLKPPYLYLVINCIIITIMASSKLQSNKDNNNHVSMFPIMQQQHVETNDYVEHDNAVFSETKVEEKLVNEFGTVSSFVDEMSNKENEFMVMNKCSPLGKRFGNRRNERASHQGGKTVLGVSKPKKQDTMESTCKTIAEGSAMPLNRHLKKSDTWERDGRSSQVEKTPPKMMKSETFNDRTNTRSQSPGSSSGGSAKMRKESSLSQDELNRRVEAFIKKFNEDMRLQRQESLNQYKGMVNRGTR